MSRADAICGDEQSGQGNMGLRRIYRATLKSGSVSLQKREQYENKNESNVRLTIQTVRCVSFRIRIIYSHQSITIESYRQITTEALTDDSDTHDAADFPLRGSVDVLSSFALLVPSSCHVECGVCGAG